MISDEIRAFFAREDDLDIEEYVIFDYYFETVVDPEEAAAHLCREQSTAQWKRVGVDEDLREEFGAKVIKLELSGTIDTFPYSTLTPKHPQAQACLVRIAHPHGNFGPKIPNLLTAACGEGAFHSPGIAAIKLMDIEFPEGYLKRFEGPQFGIQGLRDLLGVYERPIFFGVVKPNIGLAPKDFADLAYQAWQGGLDIAKDDEMLSDVAWSTLKERAALTGGKRLRYEEETGEKKMYLANITDEVHRMVELCDDAVQGGANALMINTMTTGISAARMIRRHAQVPLVSHFDFLAPFTSVPTFGVHSKVITKLQRIAGFDVIIMPGFGDRMKIPEAEVLECVQACFDPLGHMKKTLPVPAGSQWAGTTGFLFEKLNTVDLGIVPGRAVFEHPLGPEAGARSLRQGWEAVQEGVTLTEYARDHRELKEAIHIHAGG